jgi:hypothetical protein
MPGLTQHTHTRIQHRPRKTVRDDMEKEEVQTSEIAEWVFKKRTLPSEQAALSEETARARLTAHISGESLEKEKPHKGCESLKDAHYANLDEVSSPVFIGDIPLIVDWKSTLDSV